MSTETKLETPQHTLKRWARLDHRRGSLVDPLSDRVHVTSLLYAEPTAYRLLGLCVTPLANDLRVTLDTEEDLALLRGLVAELPDRPPSWAEVVAVLRARPDLVAINSGVRQKPLAAG